MAHFQKMGNIGKRGEIRTRKELCTGMVSFLSKFINPFQGNVPLQYFQKASENDRFSVFSGCRSATVA